jgi:hypothetical protein
MASKRVTQVWTQFLELQGEKPFRRQDVAELMYPLTSPRNRDAARDLADTAIQQARRDGKLVKAGHVHWKQLTVPERVLASGRVVRETPEPTRLTLETRCPGKWVALDLETGDIWAGTPKGWTRAPYSAIDEARTALDSDGQPARSGDADVAVGHFLR